MKKREPTIAQRLAQVASDFQLKRTGHAPKSVTVVLGANNLVITLHGAVTPAEQALAATPAGAAQIQKFHRELFASSSNELRAEIKRITGIAVREAAAEVESSSGTVIQTFAMGTMIQVFQLEGKVSPETWSGDPWGEAS